MAITHINRQGRAYYLHVRPTKTGKPSYFFSRKSGGALVDELPEGFEIFEDVRGQVFLRRIRPQRITPDELALIRAALDIHADGEPTLVQVEDDSILIYHCDITDLEEGYERMGLPVRRDDLIRLGNYDPAFKLEMTGEEPRQFTGYRWSFRGMGGWIPIAGARPLEDLVAALFPHLASESYFELYHGGA